MSKTMHQPVTASIEELVEAIEPESVRRSLNHVFFNFLLHNKDCLPKDFDTLTEDFYFLLRFLDQLEQAIKKQVVV